MLQSIVLLRPHGLYIFIFSTVLSSCQNRLLLVSYPYCKLNYRKSNPPVRHLSSFKNPDPVLVPLPIVTLLTPDVSVSSDDVQHQASVDVRGPSHSFLLRTQRSQVHGG